MRQFVFLFTLLLVAGLTTKAADKVSFRASAPDAVVVGEQFRLTFVVNADAKELRVQELPGLDVLMGPSQSTAYSSSWVNGQSSSETTNTFTYILMAQKEGTYNIPPATIKVKGANYTSNGLVVKVLPPDKAAAAPQSGSEQGSTSAAGVSNTDYFARMEISNANVYEQEGFLVTFKLCGTRIFGLNNVKFPEFEGFLAQEIELPQDKQWKQERYNDRNYFTVVIKQTVLYPQRSGAITIDAGKFDAVIRVATQQKVRSIFDDFFDSYQDINKTLTTSPTTIQVKALPSGKPASFSGAVGSFTMTPTISADHVKANEAVTIKLKIAGTGNIKLIKNPDVTFPNDFDVYDPKIESDVKTTTSGVSGTKTIEYMAIPRYGGDFEIPAISFSYFDVKSGSYKTLSSPAYKLHVEKGKEGEGTSPVVSTFSNKESVKYLGKDIRYLKTKEATFTSTNELFFGSAMYLMSYLFPAILFIVFFFIYRKQVKENSDIALVRTKKPNKMAIKRLKIAGKLLKENQRESFYEEILRALWGYLSDKLSIPQASLSKDNVETELSKYGVDETLKNEFMDILNTCEFARYAPSQASDAMDKLYDLTVDAIGKMENTIKK